MKDVSKTVLAVLLMIVVTISTLTIYRLSSNVNEKANAVDSLQSEIIGCQIDNGRYEIIMNRLWEVDSNFVDSALSNIE